MARLAQQVSATAVAARLRHGGFLHGAEQFDHRAFGVAQAEAAAMDPQQRLLLEEAYAALTGGGARRAALLGSRGGVFVGATSVEL